MSVFAAPTSPTMTLRRMMDAASDDGRRVRRRHQRTHRRMKSLDALKRRSLPLSLVLLLFIDVVAVRAAAQSPRPVAGLREQCRGICPSGAMADADGLRLLAERLRGGAQKEIRSKKTAKSITRHQPQQQQKRQLFASTTMASPPALARPRTIGSRSREAAESSNRGSFRLSLRHTQIALLVVVSVAGLLTLRSFLGPYLSPQQLQERTLSLLQRLQPDDACASSTTQALTVYAGFMAFVVLLGLSTIPVETAAAMVFGYRAFPASAVGKLTGAVAAYGLGRTVLRSWASDRLKNNTVFRLLQQQPVAATTTRSLRVVAARQRQSTDGLDGLRTPLATAFLMKYSCFPEFFKNFGSSLLEPVTPGRFVLATVVHGWSFTLLWTMFGVDSARRLRAASLPSAVALPRNWTLLISLALSFVVGFVVSPALMAWWIHDLRKRASQPSPLLAGSH